MRLLHVRDDLVIVKNGSLLKGFALDLFCKKIYKRNARASCSSISFIYLLEV